MWTDFLIIAKNETPITYFEILKKLHYVGLEIKELHPQGQWLRRHQWLWFLDSFSRPHPLFQIQPRYSTATAAFGARCGGE